MARSVSELSPTIRPSVNLPPINFRRGRQRLGIQWHVGVEESAEFKSLDELLARARFRHALDLLFDRPSAGLRSNALRLCQLVSSAPVW